MEPTSFNVGDVADSVAIEHVDDSFNGADVFQRRRLLFRSA